MSLSIIPVALATLLASVPNVTAQLSKTGNITLFSDTSCAKRVAVNSWILGSDVCGNLDEGFSFPTEGIFLSYIVNERPWCPAGSRPYLNVYGDEACSELIHSYGPDLIHSDLPSAFNDPAIPDADGTCVAPGSGYKAMAFICDGFPGMVEQESAIPTSSMEPERTSTSKVQSYSVATSEAEITTSTSAMITPSSSSSHASNLAASTSPMLSNGTTFSQGTFTSLPTSVFRGAGFVGQRPRSSLMALVLLVLDLLA